VDEPTIAAALTRHLGGSPVVEGLQRLSGGASRETWAFDARLGDEHLALVLRRDPGRAVTGPLERATEAEVLSAAHEAGVPTPEVRFVLEPADQLGAGFVMDRVDGETVPRRILRDDAYASARGDLAAQCGAAAARIHAVPLGALPALPTLGPLEQLAQYRGILDSFGEPHPAFELGLRRLARDVPVLDKATLVHGDFRNGNLVVGPDGLRAVLDWELTHLGDPVEDLGWLCVKSWRFGVPQHPVGGFGDVGQLTAAYEAAGGRPVDPARLRWWEAFGTLKWGVICEIQAQTHLQGLVRSVELATLGRRIAEMEWDLLELLDDASAPRADPPAPLGADARDARPDSLQDRPSAPELVAAVREFLERDVVGALEGRVGFHARVAVNALGMLERELVLGPGLDAAARARLSDYLGQDADLQDLLGELARRIREGALDDDPDAFAATRATVRSKLEVSNPRYAGGAP